MDFEFSGSERILKETLNRFGQEKLAQIAEEIDRTDRFPEWLWSSLAGLEAVQIFGGYGYSLEYPVNRFLRDAKLYTIGAGSNKIRKMIIAKELLGF